MQISYEISIGNGTIYGQVYYDEKVLAMIYLLA